MNETSRAVQGGQTIRQNKIKGLNVCIIQSHYMTDLHIVIELCPGSFLKEALKLERETQLKQKITSNFNEASSLTGITVKTHTHARTHAHTDMMSDAKCPLNSPAFCSFERRRYSPTLTLSKARRRSVKRSGFHMSLN